MNESTPSEATVETTPTQALAGVPLAGGGKTACTDCNESLREGDRVGVYARRAAGDAAFGGFRVRCRTCRRESVAHPTSGLREVILFGRLAVVTDCATRSARLTVRNLDVVADSAVENDGE